MTRSPDTAYSGILCVNKPQEFTSFDVIAKLRGMTRTRKLGHSGTLDPMATGVLPVFFGNATKACDLVPRSDKRYRAGIRFGLATDTQDIWGRPLRKDPSPVPRVALEAALSAFRGEISQLPPMYSAVQINGQRLYDLARRGIEVERPPRTVTIHSLELLAYDESAREAAIDVHCSKGTYIRTLCHDLGEALGCGAVMTSLTRTEAAGFTLADCRTFAEIEELLAEGTFAEALLPVAQLFRELPPVHLSPVQTRMFENGVRLDLNRVRYEDSGEIHAVYGPTGEFLGLADCRKETAELVMRKLFIQRS